MNKACRTNTKLDNKCPSSFGEDNHSHVSGGDNVAHINGLVNGVSHETNRSKKHKKSKKSVKIVEKSLCNDEVTTIVNAQIKQLKPVEASFNSTPVAANATKDDADSSSTSKAKSKKKKTKLNKLDSNENISNSVTDPSIKLFTEIDKTVTDVDSAINLFECLPSCSKNCDFSLPNISTDNVVTKLTESLTKLSTSTENEVKHDSDTTEKVENAPSQEQVTHPDIKFVQYESELQMPMIMKIIQKDLSEPYSIYTYRYFIHNWPKLCFLAMNEDQCVGAIVCKLDLHRKDIRRGYIAMLAVDQNYRKLRIGSTLVQMAINEMIQGNADEVVLETEVTNKPALQLYEKLGFVRDKRLFRYYLNGVDALRLKLWLT